MSTTIRAVYEDGVFKPKEPVSLEEHAEVEVLISTRPPRDPDDPTGWKAIDGLIGILKGTPPDVSENHDAYIYRKPAFAVDSDFTHRFTALPGPLPK